MAAGPGPLAQHVPVTRRIEEMSGVRPVTLLIASGIVLITAILIVTGIAANHLRRQAIETAARELAGIDGVVAEASNRALTVIDARLARVADHVGQAAVSGAGQFRETAAAPATGTELQSLIGRFPNIDAVALVAADGAVLNDAGDTVPGVDAGRALVAALRAQPTRASIVGAAIRDARSGNVGIPLAHRIDGPDGTLRGAVVAIIPAADFTSLFAAVPLPRDGVIALLRPDGSTILRYPERPGHAEAAAKTHPNLAHVLDKITATIVRRMSAKGGGSQIEALHVLADFPAAVAVSRSADQVLAEWAQQGLWFGAFAVVGAIAIAIMVALIARQFQTHAALAAMRADRIEAEKIEIERARLAAEAELLKSERLSVLGQLTATVAHELRNPLSAIRNTLFTVRELAASAGLKLERAITRMERSIERCDRIISDLLEYTRTRELNLGAVKFDRWLADMLAEQSVAAPIVLATDLGAEDVTVPIDADRVRRVVINLVENAAQALAEVPPDREKRITVHTVAEKRELVLIVEDTGPGIAPQNLDRVFEPLFSTKSFGTGLGLPTVKQIVNQHGGTIVIDSEVGRGTRVTVRLPLATVAMEDMKVAA